MRDNESALTIPLTGWFHLKPGDRKPSQTLYVFNDELNAPFKWSTRDVRSFVGFDNRNKWRNVSEFVKWNETPLYLINPAGLIQRTGYNA